MRFSHMYFSPHQNLSYQNLYGTSIQNHYSSYYSYKDTFVLDKEALEILEIMKTNANYRILVCGSAGSGKTTLLHHVCNEIEKKPFVGVIHAFNIRENGNDLLRKTDNPIFIDGLDEIRNPSILMDIIKNANIDKLVCSSRTRLNYQDEQFFTHVVEISPLSWDRACLLIKLLGNSKDLFAFRKSGIYTDGESFTPRDALRCALSNVDDSTMQDFYSHNRNLLYQYGEGVDFSSGIIYPRNEIILPKKEIITDIMAVDESLLRRAKENPHNMFNFSPREFEEMVCELLEKNGYKVKMTKQTRDGGKDIIVVQKSFLGEFCIYVECKKWDSCRPVNVGIVRELYGTVMADNATAGLIFTTSYFTKDAKEFTARFQNRMALRDYNDLVQELNRLQ